MTRFFAGAGLSFLVSASALAAQAATPASRPASQPAALTEVERIVQLERTIEEDRTQLDKLGAAAKTGEQELAAAKAEFGPIDVDFNEKTQALAKLRETGPPEAVKKAEEELAATEKKRSLALQRRKLALGAQKNVSQRIATLKEKIQQQKTALTKLTTTQPAEPPAAVPTTAPAHAQPVVPTVAPAPAPATQPVAEATEPVDEEVIEQEAKVEETKAEAQEAQQQAESLTQQLQTLETQIANEQKARDMAREQAENARQTHEVLRNELTTERRKPADEQLPENELVALDDKLQQARQRLYDADTQAREHSDELVRLQGQRATLQAEHIAALEKKRAADQRAETEQTRLEKLQNPYSLRNSMQWLLIHGPRILAILIGMALFHFFVKVGRKRLVDLVARTSDLGTPEDREARAQTLVDVFGHTASIVIVVAGIVMLLQECGLPFAPLLGGVAVVGLGVSLGAQKLIRDYFHGFVILMENQYVINDVVKIAGVAGLVERITLRMTVLRDLEGVVHFVPNGEITAVSNMTHGWSRALFEIGVAYKEDVDRVMDVLVELGKEMRKDPQYRDVILDDPTMLGLDKMSDSAIVIKFFIKTKPLEQWGVRRELNRRIKNKFDELGIEIPFPHRTIYHRYESGTRPPVPAESRRGDSP